MASSAASRWATGSIIGVSRHERIAGFATEILRVSLLNGAAAAPRPSKAVRMIEQCMIARFLITKIAVGCSKLGNLNIKR